MHELGITRNIVAIVVDAAKGKRVSRVVIEVGQLGGVMADAIAFCFDVVAKGTPLQGATLEIVRVPGRARCRACEKEFDVASLVTACDCGSRSKVVLQGEELMIKTMDIEEAA